MSDGWKGLHEFPPMTDAGNAERLAARHGSTLRWVEDRQEWRVWRDVKWTRNDLGPVYVRSLETARAIHAEAEQCDPTPRTNPLTGRPAPSDRDVLHKHATMTESRRSQEAMINLAGHMPPISASADDFDRNGWELNTPGGIQDLRNDGVVQHCKPEAMHTRCTSIAPDPFCATPTWDAFMRTITCDDADLTAYLKRAVGMSLIGVQREHVIFFCSGDGSNGKGTFLNTLVDVIGDYGMTLPGNMLIEKRTDSHPTELADLEGRRLAIGTEVPRGAAWNEVLIKMLTGGDKVRARRMRQDFYEFPPQHTLWISGNDKPRIKGTDNGIWRRMRLIPFRARIPAADMDRDLPAKLLAEAAGILSWCLDGCAEYLREGLGSCAAVKEATDAYRRDEDMLGAFLDDCCRLGSHYTARKTAFREAFRKWSEDQGMRSMSDRALKPDLERKGIVEGREGRSGERVWLGVELREPFTYEIEAGR